MGRPPDEDVPDDEEQRRGRQQRREPDQQEEQQREGPAQVGPGPLAEAHAVDGGEAVDVAHQSILLLSSEKQRLMSRIKTKSTTPVAISASRWSPEA